LVVLGFESDKEREKGSLTEKTTKKGFSRFWCGAVVKAGQSPPENSSKKKNM